MKIYRLSIKKFISRN